MKNPRCEECKQEFSRRAFQRHLDWHARKRKKPEEQNQEPSKKSATPANQSSEPFQIEVDGQVIFDSRSDAKSSDEDETCAGNVAAAADVSKVGDSSGDTRQVVAVTEERQRGGPATKVTADGGQPNKWELIPLDLSRYWVPQRDPRLQLAGAPSLYYENRPAARHLREIRTMAMKTIPVVSFTKVTKSQIIKEERAVLKDGTKYELITYFNEEKSHTDAATQT